MVQISSTLLQKGIAALLLLAAPLALSGCGEDAPEVDDTGLAGDPAITGALGDHIMVDPDLASQNEANSALTTSARSGAVPSESRSDRAIEAAQEEAERILRNSGGAKTAPPPQPAMFDEPIQPALTVTARAAALAGAGECADKATYTMQWAARMPAAFPIYPRGAVQEAAGIDEGACAMRLINFITPVPPVSVADFYFSRAENSGYSSERLLIEDHDVISGTKGMASYTVAMRELPWGGTEVDLVTSES